MTDYIITNWEWFTVILLALYLVTRRFSAAYSRAVQKELEEYVQPASPPVVVATPSPATDDSFTMLQERAEIWQKIGANPPERQVQLLVEALAQVIVERRFFDIYYRIWQSQLSLLRGVNSLGGTVSRADAEQFFAGQAKSITSLSGVTFINWINFLANEGLLITGTASFSISKTGQDFLVWFVRKQLREKTG